MTRNYGFAGGNNRGLEAAGYADYTLLLNSDTVAHPGCLAYCRGVMERDAGIGAMSCMLLNKDGSVQNVARRFPSPARVAAVTLGLDSRFPRVFGWADTEDAGWDRRTAARDVDWLGGAFLLIRGSVLARTGPMDESFFFYGEDIEFCHRIRRAGFRCRYDPGASITHFGGGSSDPARLAAKARSVHAWSARYRVQRLCYGRVAAACVRMIDIAGIAARLAWARVRGRTADDQSRDWAASLRVITHRLGAPS
jgi:GT2 family glycosyltransferase